MWDMELSKKFIDKAGVFFTRPDTAAINSRLETYSYISNAHKGTALKADQRRVMCGS